MRPLPRVRLVPLWVTSLFCSLCGQHARHAKSPIADLRRKLCPRFPDGATRSLSEGPAQAQLGVVHRGCCAQEPCSQTDGLGHVRCMWEKGGRERLLALKEPAREPRAPRPRA